ncbi:polyprenol reductase [Bombyx mori]|uniref:Polyprenal reductase n=1 Tax=Bombyx mori TaxID=7091 RepID=A0A8R2AN40_BOMMO|nr:polyprenol reductase [Bombyx mori]
MPNILDFVFLNLAISVTFTGVLIKKFEDYVPAFIKKSFSYGSFAYQGSEANFLKIIEIPKAYYRHFYLFSSIFSVLSLFYMILVYFLGFSVNEYLFTVLNYILLEDQTPVSVTAALLALSLLTLQCLRRLYETYYLQVFAKSSKMNISHYFAGIIHYFACIVVCVGQAPLFCGSQNREKVTWIDTKTTILFVPCTLIFLWCWYEQYQTNIIFAYLRKDKKSNKIVTEDHRVPNGRMFKYVSSPHRMCEIIMYTVLVFLITTKTFVCIYLWVLSNQIQTGIHAHEWYKKTFKNYPAKRTAVFPYVL